MCRNMCPVLLSPRGNLFFPESFLIKSAAYQTQNSLCGCWSEQLPPASRDCSGALQSEHASVLQHGHKRRALLEQTSQGSAEKVIFLTGCTLYGPQVPCWDKEITMQKWLRVSPALSRFSVGPQAVCLPKS